MAPKDGHALLPRTNEYITLYSRGELRLLIS